MSEKSASAIQIEERKERLTAMMSLAMNETKKLIEGIYKENPKLTQDQILNIMKQRDFSTSKFLNEYMLQDNCSVQEKTARQYFNQFINRLNPSFIETKSGHFRLNDVLLSGLTKAIKKESEKA